MKKIYLRSMLFCLVAIYSCKDAKVTETSYAKLKKMPYTTMSVEEKVIFKDEVVKHLKADPDFKAVNKMIDAQAIAIFAAAKERRAKGMKKLGPLSSDLTIAERNKKLGIKDEFANEKNLSTLLIKMSAVLKKYPEIGKLDKKTKKELFKLASSKK